MIDRAMIVGVLSVAIVAASHGAELGYYAQPTLHGDRLVFVSEGDLWTARLPETLDQPIVAYRLTSSDGRHLPTLMVEGMTDASDSYLYLYNPIFFNSSSNWGSERNGSYKGSARR